MPDPADAHPHRTPRRHRLLPLVLALTALLLIASALAVSDETLSVRARSGADIDTMDPAFYRGNEEFNLDLAVYSKLMRFAPGSTELVLDAAEWVDLSDDGTVVEFRLREGIQFHHGYGEMTVEDVKFSFERIADPDNESPYASEWSALVEVEVIDRYRGRIILDDVYAPLLSSSIPFTTGSIVSKAAFEDRGDQIATRPVGSGPYYWAAWEPNQRIVLERFDGYYGDAPYFKTIEVLPIIDPLIAEFSFDVGELTSTEVSLESVERYLADEGVVVSVLDTLRYHWIGFNVQAAPFDDVRVREAIRLTVDIDEIITGAYNGVPNRANTMLAADILGHWADAPAYQPDLERAQALLAEAGYPDGFRTTLITDDVPVHQQAAAIVQQQLRRVGIEADIRIVQSMYDDIGQGGAEGMHYASFSAVLDPGYWFEWFSCDQIGRWNYWHWCNEEYDALKDEAARTAEPDERAERYVRMQQLIDEDVPAIWVTNGASIYVHRAGELEPSFLAMYAQYMYWTGSQE
jgi:peptide/nickel transport system substrate-binding protein